MTDQSDDEFDHDNLVEAKVGMFIYLSTFLFCFLSL